MSTESSKPESGFEYDLILNKYSKLTELIIQKQRNYINGMKTKLNYVVTPELVSFYNIMHNVINTSLRDIPLDVCSFNGGFMCLGISTLNNFSASEKDYKLMNNYNINIGVDKGGIGKSAPSLVFQAIKILDEIKIDIVDKSISNVRNEFIGNISVMNELFNNKLNEFQADIIEKDRQISMRKRDLVACQSLEVLLNENTSLLGQINELRQDKLKLEQKIVEIESIHREESSLNNSTSGIENLYEFLNYLRTNMDSTNRKDMLSLSASMVKIDNELTSLNDMLSNIRKDPSVAFTSDTTADGPAVKRYIDDLIDKLNKTYELNLKQRRELKHCKDKLSELTETNAAHLLQLDRMVRFCQNGGENNALLLMYNRDKALARSRNAEKELRGYIRNANVNSSVVQRLAKERDKYLEANRDLYARYERCRKSLNQFASRSSLPDELIAQLLKIDDSADTSNISVVEKTT